MGLLDIRQEFDDNQDYYGPTTPLDKVARQVHSNSQFASTPYEDWLKNTVVPGQIEEDNYQREVAKTRAEDIGLVKEYGRGVVRGAMQGLPEAVGQSLQLMDRAITGEGEAPTIVDQVGKGIEAFGTGMKKKMPGWEPSKAADEPGSWQRAASGAGESTALSLTPWVVGGATAAVTGNPLAGIAAGTASMVPLFYGATTEQKLREGEAAGLSKEDNIQQANISGVSEVVTEWVSDLVGGLVFRGLGSPAKAAVKEGVGGIIRSVVAGKSLGQIAKDFFVTGTVESGSEVLNTFIQSQSDKSVGLNPEQDTASEMVDSAKSALIMTMVFNAFGVPVGMKHASNVRKTLLDPEAPTKDVYKAISETAHGINEADPDLAKLFTEQAIKLHSVGKPIIFDDDAYYEKGIAREEAAKEAKSISILSLAKGAEAITPEMLSTVGLTEADVPSIMSARAQYEKALGADKVTIDAMPTDAMKQGALSVREKLIDADVLDTIRPEQMKSDAIIKDATHWDEQVKGITTQFGATAKELEQFDAHISAGVPIDQARYDTIAAQHDDLAQQLTEVTKRRDTAQALKDSLTPSITIEDEDGKQPKSTVSTSPTWDAKTLQADMAAVGSDMGGPASLAFAEKYGRPAYGLLVDTLRRREDLDAGALLEKIGDHFKADSTVVRDRGVTPEEHEQNKKIVAFLGDGKHRGNVEKTALQMGIETTHGARKQKYSTKVLFNKINEQLALDELDINNPERVITPRVFDVNADPRVQEAWAAAEPAINTIEAYRQGVKAGTVTPEALLAKEGELASLASDYIRTKNTALKDSGVPKVAKTVAATEPSSSIVVAPEELTTTTRTNFGWMNAKEREAYAKDKGIDIAGLPGPRAVQLFKELAAFEASTAPATEPAVAPAAEPVTPVTPVTPVAAVAVPAVPVVPTGKVAAAKVVIPDTLYRGYADGRETNTSRPGTPIHLSVDPNVAIGYPPEGKGGNLGAYTHALKNPKIYSYKMRRKATFATGAKQVALLQKQGYDGAVSLDEQGNVHEVIAFSRDQLKRVAVSEEAKAALRPDRVKVKQPRFAEPEAETVVAPKPVPKIKTDVRRRLLTPEHEAELREAIKTSTRVKEYKSGFMEVLDTDLTDQQTEDLMIEMVRQGRERGEPFLIGDAVPSQAEFAVNAAWAAVNKPKQPKETKANGESKETEALLNLVDYSWASKGDLAQQAKKRGIEIPRTSGGGVDVAKTIKALQADDQSRAKKPVPAEKRVISKSDLDKATALTISSANESETVRLARVFGVPLMAKDKVRTTAQLSAEIKEKALNYTKDLLAKEIDVANEKEAKVARAELVGATEKIPGERKNEQPVIVPKTPHAKRLAKAMDLMTKADGTRSLTDPQRKALIQAANGDDISKTPKQTLKALETRGHIVQREGVWELAGSMAETKQMTPDEIDSVLNMVAVMRAASTPYSTLTVGDVKAGLRKLLGVNTLPSAFVVVPTQRDLPARIQQDLGEGRLGAAAYKGKIYLIANEVQNVQQSLLEVITHEGTHHMFRDDSKFRARLNDVFDHLLDPSRLSEADKVIFDAAVADVEFAASVKPLSELETQHELLAYYMQRVAADLSARPENAPKYTLWQKLINAVRDYLFKHWGLTAKQIGLTPRDMIRMIMTDLRASTSESFARTTPDGAAIIPLHMYTQGSKEKQDFKTIETKHGYLDYHEEGGTVVLRDIHVDKEVRGKGFGTELMNSLKKEFPNRPIILGAVSKEMDKLAARAGFELISPRNKYMPDDAIPDIVNDKAMNTWKFTPGSLPLAQRKQDYQKAIEEALAKQQAKEAKANFAARPTTQEAAEQAHHEDKFAALGVIAQRAADAQTRKLAELTNQIMNTVNAEQSTPSLAETGGVRGYTRTKSTQTTNIFTRLFSLPEYYMRRDSAAEKVLEWAQKQSEIKFTVEQMLVSDTFVSTLKTMKKNDPRSYKASADYLLSVDKTGVGFSISLKGDWNVMSPTGVSISTHASEMEAIAAMVAAEQKALTAQGFSESSKKMVKEVRDLTNRGFDVIAEDMRRQVKLARDNGLAEPTTNHVNADGKGETIKLSEAIAFMGDLRGSYFPRERPQKEFVLTAQKEGVNGKKVLVPIDLYLPANELDSALKAGIKGFINRKLPVSTEIKKLIAMGFKESEIAINPVKAAAETIYDTPGLLTSVDALMTAAIDNLDQSKMTVIERGLLESINAKIAHNIGNVYKAKGSFSSRMKRSESHWEGYEEDPLKALTSYAQRLAAGVSRRAAARGMLEAFTGRDVSFADFKKSNSDATYKEYRAEVKRKAIDAITQKNLFDDVRLYMSHVLRPDNKVERFVGYLKGLTVLKFLGFRVSSAAVNATNMAFALPATISAHTGLSITKAWAEITTASAKYAKFRAFELEGSNVISRGLKDHLGKQGLSAADHNIFAQIAMLGWDQAQFNQETVRVLQNTANETWNNTMSAAMYMFGAVERANRAISIFAATKAFMRANPALSLKEAMQKAHHTSNRAHGEYGKGAKPWLVQKVRLLDMPYTFFKFQQNYMLNMLELGIKYNRWGTAVPYMLMSPAILAGAGASLVTPVIAAAISALGGGDDPEEAFYAWAEKSFGSDAFLRHGMAGLLGINLKGSLEITSPFPDLSKGWLGAMGAPGGVFLDIADAVDAFKDGQYEKGLEKLLPTAVGSIVKGHREYTEGVTNKQYSPVFYGTDKLKGSPIDFAMRVLAFNPERVSGIRQKQWRESVVRQEYAKERSGIIEGFNHALINIDKTSNTDFADLYKRITAYNSKVTAADPLYQVPYITNKWLLSSLKRNQKPDKYETKRVVRAGLE